MKFTQTQHHKSPFAKTSIQFLLIIFLLTAIGIINFYSITHSSGPHLSPIFWRQTLWTFIGIILFVCLSFIDYKFFLRISGLIYGVNVLFLILILFFGQSFHGAQRWLNLGWFSYQPAETMQLALILVLAHLFAKKPVHYIYGFKQIFPVFLLIIIPMALIICQPDLGTALLIGIQACTLICFLKITRNVVISLVVLILIISPAMWMFVLKDYQKDRILTFASSYKDPQGAGYNTIQSKIAIGSGRIFGKGLKKGSQAQLEFLPERHTDFAFSVLSEEHGFAGSLLVATLFFFLILKILKMASWSRDKQGVYLCLGSLSIIFWHVFINIGMTTGILPVVGIPLPFLSYGGTSAITTFCALGLISSVFSRRYLYS